MFLSEHWSSIKVKYHDSAVKHGWRFRSCERVNRQNGKAWFVDGKQLWSARWIFISIDPKVQVTFTLANRGWKITFLWTFVILGVLGSMASMAKNYITYIHMYMYIHIHTYKYTHTHTHTHTQHYIWLHYMTLHYYTYTVYTSPGTLTYLSALSSCAAGSMSSSSGFHDGYPTW